MKLFILAVASIAALGGCANDGSEEQTNAMTRGAVAATLAASPNPPRLDFFSSADSATAVVDGAGCSYTAPRVTGDSMLFAYATDGGMMVNGRTQILKLLDEGRASDSISKLRFENAGYRVELRTITDSMMEGGVSQHGEMMVEEKSTGAKTTVAIVGGCGC